MTSPDRTGTRDIARAAVQAELGQVALDLFLQKGFENVTSSDLAAAAGVSRSTFLRYFATKEEAVVGVIDAQGAIVADALRARPLDEDDWTALRHALDSTIEPFHQDPGRALAITRLVRDSPALRARRLEKQNGWEPVLAQALADRGRSGQSPTLSNSVWAVAALGCLNVALDRWSASDGRLDLAELLDEAFATIAAPRELPGRRRRRSVAHAAGGLKAPA